ADQAVVLDSRTHRLEHFAVPALTGDHEAVHGDPLHLAITHQLEEFGVIQCSRFGRTTEIVHHSHQHCSDDQPKNEVFRHIVQIAILLPATWMVRPGCIRLFTWPVYLTPESGAAAVMPV